MFHGGKKCRPNGATKEKKLTAVQMMLRFITAANKLALTLSSERTPWCQMGMGMC